MACPSYNPRRSGDKKTLAYEHGLIAGRSSFPEWNSVPSRYYILEKMRNTYSIAGHSSQGRKLAENDFIAGWKDGLEEAMQRNPRKSGIGPMRQRSKNPGKLRLDHASAAHTKFSDDDVNLGDLWWLIGGKYEIVDDDGNVLAEGSGLNQKEAIAKAKAIFSRISKRGRANPLFLPKSLFDSYIVRSDGGEVTVDKIQTIAGAERKVRELARKYPCVGFAITSAKHGGTIKHYAAAVGKSTPKVDEDNSREYKRDAAKEAKQNMRFRLYVNGSEFADYETKAEAEKVGRKEAGTGGRWRVKEVQANPNWSFLGLQSEPPKPHVRHFVEDGDTYAELTTPQYFEVHVRSNVTYEDKGGARGYYVAHGYESAHGVKRKLEKAMNFNSDWDVTVKEHPAKKEEKLVRREFGRNPSDNERKALAFHKEAIRKAVRYRGYMIAAHGNGRYMVYPPRDDAHSLDGTFTIDSVRAAKAVIDEAEAETNPVAGMGRRNPDVPQTDYDFHMQVKKLASEHERSSVTINKVRTLYKAFRAYMLAKGLPAKSYPNWSPSQKMPGWIAKPFYEAYAKVHTAYGREREALRRNPDDSDGAAAELYEQFHGEPSDGITVYEEQVEIPEDFVELGDLVELKVATLHGKDVTITAPDPDRYDVHEIVKLASSPDGRQLYFIGGDESLQLDKLGFKGDEVKPHMVIGVLYELTYRTRKHFDKMKLTDYYHATGEDTGNQPMLNYDGVNGLMSVVGGEYKVRAEGIIN